MLADVATGYPLLLTEMTILTALRTAATSAMAAKYLAPKGAATMAIIGNGAQCEFQALAFKAMLGIKAVRLYDIDPAATRKAARNLVAAGLSVTACRSAEEAVLGAEIVTTATADKARARILTDNMIGAGDPHQRHRRRLPRQDRARPRHSRPRRGVRGISRRRRGSRARFSRCRPISR